MATPENILSQILPKADQTEPAPEPKEPDTATPQDPASQQATPSEPVDPEPQEQQGS